jgi:cellulose synthase/poly-beta-1,6-N-acetylglucosamine synthase-like glycosyltransferase
VLNDALTWLAHAGANAGAWLASPELHRLGTALSQLPFRLSTSWVGHVILFFSIAIFVQYAVLNVLACFEARREWWRQSLADRLSLFEGDLAPPISILVPAHNEAPTIVESIRSLMQLRYPSFEVIVVNDGSTDRTLDVMIDAFALRPAQRAMRARVPRERLRGVFASPRHPGLVVVDVNNGGKATALNIALAFSRWPLFLAIDADSVLERDTLLQLALPFYHDSAVAVTGGVVRPSNGSLFNHGRVVSARLSPRSIPRFQTVEYLRGMLAGRMGWNLLDSLFIVSGALGLFSREAVMAVGGYRSETLGEDMELVMRLQRWALRMGQAHAVRFVPVAVAWTEVPESLRALARQRARWHQGLAESLWLNRGLLFSRHVTPRLAIAFACQFVVELLGPLWELFGLAMVGGLALTGHLHVSFALMYIGVFVAGGTINSMFGIALENVMCPRYPRARDSVILILYALLEGFGYRQLTAWWRVQGLWRVLMRRKDWGSIARLGHQPADVRERERRAA